MVPDLGQLIEGWPFAASMAAAVGARGIRDARRRTALNEALHELRRPLQVLALGAPRDAGAGEERSAAAPLQMAAAALARLDREINGGAGAATRLPVAAEPLLRDTFVRWRQAALLAGHSLRLYWLAGEAVVAADPVAVAQALDNLIANAIEHGGPRVIVEARRIHQRLRIVVRDSGRRRSDAQRPSDLALRLSGRRRRGHGLRVVRRIAREHEGGFELRRSPAGTEAVLELPLCRRGAGL